MLLANFNRKEHLRHRAVSLWQHGFLVASCHVLMYGSYHIPSQELLTLSELIHVGSARYTGCTTTSSIHGRHTYLTHRSYVWLGIISHNDTVITDWLCGLRFINVSLAGTTQISLRQLHSSIIHIFWYSHFWYSHFLLVIIPTVSKCWKCTFSFCATVLIFPVHMWQNFIRREIALRVLYSVPDLQT